MPRTLAGTRTITGNRNLVQGLTFDGVQNYLNLGTMGTFGSNLGSGFYAKIKLQTISQAAESFGYYFAFPATHSGASFNLNRNGGNSHVVGSVSVGVNDVNNLYLIGTANNINFYDGNIHTLEFIVNVLTKTITINFDGVSQAITYNNTDTLSSFDNFQGNFTIGVQNDSGGLSRYFAGTIFSLLLGTAANNLFGKYNFFEGSGTTASDGSGNGNTGTLTGSPLPTWVKRSVAS